MKKLSTNIITENGETKKITVFVDDETAASLAHCDEEIRHLFIVRQRLSILCSEEENNAVISRDTFYKRTPARNAEYEEIFKKREQIDGKRLPSSGYIREYRE